MGVRYVLADRNGAVRFGPDDAAHYLDEIATRERRHTTGDTPYTDLRRRDLRASLDDFGSCILGEHLDAIVPVLDLPIDAYPERRFPAYDRPVYGTDCRLLRDVLCEAREELERRDPTEDWTRAFDVRWLAVVDYALEHDLGVTRL